jgi:hypothetical protein
MVFVPHRKHTYGLDGLLPGYFYLSFRGLAKDYFTVRRDLFCGLWHIRPLVGSDRETTETTAIARQQLYKYTTIPRILPAVEELL